MLCNSSSFVERVLDLLRSQNQSFDFSYRFTGYLRGGFLLFAYFLASRFHIAHNFILHLQGWQRNQQASEFFAILNTYLGWKPRRSSSSDPRYSNMRRLTPRLGGRPVIGYLAHFVTTYQLFWMSCARRRVVIKQKPAFCKYSRVLSSPHMAPRPSSPCASDTVDLLGGSMGFMKRRAARPRMLETLKTGLEGLA
jgi:hypothetical protein